ncbi:glycosyl hydrolase [Paenibacillus sp. LjRoot56]|uniref:glycosyl hydrolase n=1 Tax=Paenibacillus sp. LjRoot56 TaxID=3342333 RepID=UPI003ED02632
MALNKSGLLQKFENPPVERRSVPFWSWNGTMEQEELDRQIEGFKEQGMGGFMMHVREGLETPYMGEAFMDRVKDSVAKAKAEGIQAWLYDEDRYSSGMGGGHVPRIGGDAVRAKALTLTVSHSLHMDDEVLAVYRAQLSGDRLLTCERLTPPTLDTFTLLESEVFLIFRRIVAAPNEWCHGDTYPDHLNPEATRIFIETTYETYKAAVGGEFGRTVPGIFTDEPSLLGFKEELKAPEMTWITWSDELPQAFAEKNGYDIWDALPYFYYHGAPSAKVRFDYWKTVTVLFCQSFTKQIGDWCRENALAFTGHFCDEADLVGAVRHQGALMPNYRYMDIPGIDILCEQTDESLGVKHVSSIANQYGKKRVITETYGVTGWGLTFEARKWIGDWQFVLGVNLMTYHLSLYTLRGCRKRDYPPSFNYNTNWWPHNHVMEQYFARLGAVLSEGRVRRDVLVIHPSTTVWSQLGCDVKANEWRNDGGNIENLNAYNREFNAFVQHLLGQHVDFDLGDELCMQEDGFVVEGCFGIGQASYPIVILPSLSNLLQSTLKLLMTFMDAGGVVLAYGQVPTLLDAEPSNELHLLTGHHSFKHRNSWNELILEIEQIAPRTVRLTASSGEEAERLLYMRRELPDCTIVFVVNNDREASYEVEVGIEGSGGVEEWDLLSGEVIAKQAQANNGYLHFEACFGPAESKLYVISKVSKRILPNAKKHSPLGQGMKLLTKMEGITSFSRTHPNALVMDACQYRLGEAAWSDTMEVWQAQQAVRQQLGMRPVYANGKLQRHFWIHEPHASDGTSVAFRFTFHVKNTPKTDTQLVFEQLERFHVELNGHPVPGKPDGWFLDRSMSSLKLPSLREGENELVIRCAYTHDMEVENAFLIGDFALDHDRSLILEPTRLALGDWTKQGYPHYCGSMIYHYDLEADISNGKRIMLKLGDYEAVTLLVTVNETHRQAIPWRAAGTVELTNWLVQGQNRIDMEVVGSPRNLLGPLHERPNDSGWADWWSFHPDEANYTQAYRLQPYGLMGAVEIYQEE